MATRNVPAIEVDTIRDDRYALGRSLIVCHNCQEAKAAAQCYRVGDRRAVMCLCGAVIARVGGVITLA